MIAPDHTSGELNASGAQHANADLRSNQSNPENMIFRTRAKNQVDLHKVSQVDLGLSHRTVQSCNGPDKIIHRVPWPGASNLSPRNRWPTTKYKMKIRKLAKFLEILLPFLLKNDSTFVFSKGTNPRKQRKTCWARGGALRAPFILIIILSRGKYLYSKQIQNGQGLRPLSVEDTGNRLSFKGQRFLVAKVLERTRL